MDLEKIRQEKFKENNGQVLRAVNMLREKYIRIRDLKFGLEPGINQGELTDCLNYLSESGYIKMRDYETHEAVGDIADADVNQLEAKLTAKGISLLAGTLTDKCIRR